MNMDSSSDNEELATAIENKNEKISNLTSLYKNNIIAHYVNEKVTLEGYDRQEQNTDKKITNISYENMPQKND